MKWNKHFTFKGMGRLSGTCCGMATLHEGKYSCLSKLFQFLDRYDMFIDILCISISKIGIISFSFWQVALAMTRPRNFVNMQKISNICHTSKFPCLSWKTSPGRCSSLHWLVSALKKLFFIQWSIFVVSTAFYLWGHG